MARIFITGSTDGLGRAAAATLLDAGHEVVLHARNEERAASLADLAGRAAGVAIGDLADANETQALAEQVNALGHVDTVIHNAGLYIDRRRVATAEGHARILAVNVLAPYLLTAAVRRPARLIYLSSGMHHGGDSSLYDIDWMSRRWNGAQAYSDSKLYVATLAFAVARHWRDVCAHAVDPGWVPTKMGGPGASDDLELGHETQEWLAVTGSPDATGSPGYWFHRRRQAPHEACLDERFQDALLDKLARMTGVDLRAARPPA
jgi:NAD(P)-dependent dehydrogenase (short-subunit alcohol dehydrogenase family)